MEGGRYRTDDRRAPRSYDGFGPSLDEDDLSELPDGCFLTVLDGEPPSTDPGDTCAGYRLVGPRTLLLGGPTRPEYFVQRLDLPGCPFGRFLLLSNGEWMFCGAFSSKAAALKF